MNGVLFVNKPEGLTSRDVVNQISRIYGTKKVGHTGTLDPMATGVLIVCLGSYTKLVNLLTSSYKEYIADMKFGVKTDTGDVTGNVLETKEVNLSYDELKRVIDTFPKEYIQTVPKYSAVKVNGKKLYEYAREGKEVKLPKRQVFIEELELLEYQDGIARFRCVVSKGTYIRSLCEDIATKLETVGHMCELKRIQVGNFNIANSITLEELENQYENKEWIKSHMISIEELFKEKHVIELDDIKLKLFLNGVQLTKEEKDEIYRIYNRKQFIGIGVIKNNLLKRDIII